MWCPACQADVAAELSSDSRHFRCTRCALELGTAAGATGTSSSNLVQPKDAERNARELLARWNAQSIWEPPSGRTVTPQVESISNPALPDVALQTDPSSADNSHPETMDQPTELPRKRKRKKIRRHDAEMPQSISRSVPLANLSEIQLPKTNSWGMTLGQICAYFGIGLITCGTALMLWGYFGGPTQLAPTGWLITSLGQMFLFLGVVTLVSNGMEQTTAEVAARMEVLGQQLIRIEQQHLQADLRGPHRRPNAVDDYSSQSARVEDVSIHA